MNHKTRLFALSTFSLAVLVFAFGLASAVVSFTNPQGVIQTVNSGTQVTASFNLQENGEGNFTSIDLDTPIHFTGCAGSRTFDSTPVITGAPATLSQSATSGTITARFNIPQSQYGCVYTGYLVLSGQYTAPAAYPLQLTITVNSSPAITITKKTDLTQTQNGSIEIKNNGNVDLSNIAIDNPSGDFDVKFYDGANEITQIVSLSAGSTKTVTVSPVNLGTIGFGGKSTQITATATGGTTATINLSISGSFCKAGEAGTNLEITEVNIDNTGAGDDSDWQLLDTVEVEVRVDNNGNDDVKKVFVDMGLYDSTGKNRVGDLEFDNSDEEQFDIGTIKDGNDETATFKFKVPADMDDGDYKLVVKAYSDDLKEENECTNTASDLSDDTFESVTIERESDEGKYISFDEITFTPNEPTCGETVSMRLDVLNIGDEDQDQVRINLKNTELGIDEFFEIRNDLNQGDSETVNFDFAIPQNAKDKLYNLALSSEYDYRNGNYRQESDDDTIVQLRVLGCSGTGNGGTGERIAIISATLDSDEVTSGGEAVVRTTITNLKTTNADFTVRASGYQSWSTLSDSATRTIQLAPGESEDLVYTFEINDDANGEESFNVEVRDASGNSETREVAVNIAGETGGQGSSFDLGDNKFLWIIGIVNVVLIVLIIIVAVRVARR